MSMEQWIPCMDRMQTQNIGCTLVESAKYSRNVCFQRLAIGFCRWSLQISVDLYWCTHLWIAFEPPNTQHDPNDTATHTIIASTLHVNTLHRGFLSMKLSVGSSNSFLFLLCFPKMAQKQQFYIRKIYFKKSHLVVNPRPTKLNLCEFEFRIQFKFRCTQKILFQNSVQYYEFNKSFGSKLVTSNDGWNCALDGQLTKCSTVFM